MPKTKEYEVVTKIVWVQITEADSVKQAKEVVRQTFLDEYGINPRDAEMKVRLRSSKKRNV